MSEQTYKLTEELKSKIDAMSHSEMAHTWLFAHIGNSLLMGETGEYFKDRLLSHFGGFTPEISQKLKWGDREERMIMIEYNDGTFSEIKDSKTLLSEVLKNNELLKDAKAIHLGATADDLENLKEILKKENGIELRFQLIASHIAGIEMDVNKIIVHLGLDDKTEILPVKP